jgi:hypothetical protein
MRLFSSPRNSRSGRFVWRRVVQTAGLAISTSCLFLSPAATRAQAAPPTRWDIWTDGAPLAEGVRSAIVIKDDTPLKQAASPQAAGRGSVVVGSRLPVYGTARGTGCARRWLLVGPSAWICGRAVELSTEPPLAASERFLDEPDGLPFRYFFVSRDGSAAYSSLGLADDAAPTEELQPGFAVAAVEEATKGGERYVRTHHGNWVPKRDLIPVRGTGFRGEELTAGKLQLGWVLDDKTPVLSKARGGAKVGSRSRFEVIDVQERQGQGASEMIKVADDSWIAAKHLRIPTLSAPPKEAHEGERWLDMDLATQTLVAYEGKTPVFATLVSSGKGKQGTELATPRGVHRIWVKLRSSTMDNLEDENASSTYAIEDVPYVQYFSKGAGLHGAFWHKGFGRVRSHGCINLAPLDAQRLFGFTSPRLPAGWSAVLPTANEPGTIVRVR